MKDGIGFLHPAIVMGRQCRQLTPTFEGEQR
jgi:hypothetical protein